jgi:hypothetical protein
MALIQCIDIKGAKIDCLSLFMCPLLAQLIIGFFSLFWLQPFTVLMKKTRAVKQSIIFRCLWFNAYLESRKKNRIPSQGDQKIWTNSSNFSQSSLQAQKMPDYQHPSLIVKSKTSPSNHYWTLNCYNKQHFINSLCRWKFNLFVQAESYHFFGVLRLLNKS